ncbi:hypothetical protein KFL_001900050 [Klebsormidium nitens]|uniref:RING-type E3 ubiquitin transferase n=1 Tax=Klebsormidium nitens TaxID=105231 RepID=A0A1Y1I3C9_KLENI|nr:hypothetical protein KFL_001900050 [Klebsormidium nitens]|eukprot:GAQ84462.1 hypothetical protein KFL_001900050 [Klebsormidium nitens]
MPSLGVCGAVPAPASARNDVERPEGAPRISPHPSSSRRTAPRRSASSSPHVIQLDSDSEQSAPGDSPYRLPGEGLIHFESREGDALSGETSPGMQQASFSTREVREADHGSPEGEGGFAQRANKKRKSRWDLPSEGEEQTEQPRARRRQTEDLEVLGMQSTCPICLNDIPPEEKAVLKSCMHVFCVECIRAWSEIRRVCPLCKGGFTGWWYDIQGEGASREVSLPPPPQNETSGRLERTRDHSNRGAYLNQETEERFNARPYYHRLQRGLQSDRRRPPGGPNQAHEREDQGGRRTQPAPRQRVFTPEQDGTEERALRWRRSIYDRGLEAVEIGGPVGRVGRSQDVARSQRRLAPWIERELRALLGEADPLVTQLVTSLWRSASEFELGGNAGGEPVAQLEPFLGDRAAAFWHELRCFASSPFTMHTYDCVAQYRRRRSPESGTPQYFRATASRAGSHHEPRPASTSGANGRGRGAQLERVRNGAGSEAARSLESRSRSLVTNDGTQSCLTGEGESGGARERADTCQERMPSSRSQTAQDARRFDDARSFTFRAELASGVSRAESRGEQKLVGGLSDASKQAGGNMGDGVKKIAVVGRVIATGHRPSRSKLI